MVSEIFSMSPFWGFPTGVTTKPWGVIQGASSSSSGQVALSKSLAWCWVTAGKKMGTAKGQNEKSQVEGCDGYDGYASGLLFETNVSKVDFLLLY